MDNHDWHYAIVGIDLALFRFRTEDERDDFLSDHSDHAFKFLDITLTSGLDTAVWKMEFDKKSMVPYEWTRVWLYAG